MVQTKICLRLWKCPNDNHLKTISNWSKLLHLRIENGASISSTGIAYLSSLQKLQTLHLKDCTSISDEGLMKCLDGLTNLANLCVDLCQTTDYWLVSLSKLKCLESIIFRDSETLTDTSMQYFRHLTRLKHFELNGYHKLTTSALSYLTTHLKFLRLGYSRRNYKITFPLLIALHITGNFIYFFKKFIYFFFV